MGSSKTLVSILKSRIFIPLLLILLCIPLFAHASVFSFFSSLFSPRAEAAEENLPNSQNMALLEAPHSVSPHATSTRKEIAILDGNSLSSETASSGTTDHTFANDQISIYVVHKDDTLPAIAKMFGVSVNTIRWGNNITGNTLTVGQTLVILPVSGVQHVVKKGDTLQSIAKLHKGDLNEILQYNNLSSDAKLAVGDVIIVPDGEFVAGTNTGASSGVKSPNNAGVGTPGASTPTYSGYYMRPIIGGIKTQGIHGHNGVDLASAYGSNILAAADGEVIISKNSGWNGGYGSYVVIKHGNGTQTLYGHLSNTAVSVGESVKQGQIIGYMGQTGKATGVHLHFEIRGATNPF